MLGLKSKKSCDVVILALHTQIILDGNTSFISPGFLQSLSWVFNDIHLTTPMASVVSLMGSQTVNASILF